MSTNILNKGNLIMLLCDIGNTSYHFFDTTTKKDYKKSIENFNLKNLEEQIYYICVHPKIKTLLHKFKNWIDISSYIDMNQYYITMGIDRIIALEAIDNGIIIDAGSAITVDIKQDDIFQGGFIYPGSRAMSESYKNISSALDYPFNFDIDLTQLPKNSKDAITYGYLKTLYLEVMSHNQPIILTGGDAKKFSKIFPTAKVDEFLIFKGMQKIIFDIIQKN